MRSKLARWLPAALLLAVVASPVLAAGRGWLGVTTQSTDDDMRRGLDLMRDGLLVNQVTNDSPADRAGLRKGDVILTFNGRSVTEPEGLRRLVRATEPGRTASLSVWRNGSRRTLQVQVGSLPGSDDEVFETPEPPTPPTPPAAPRAPRAPRAPDLFDEDDDQGEHGEHGEHRMFIDGKEVPQDEIEETLKGMKIKLKGLDKLGETQWWNDGNGRRMFMAPMATGRGRLGVRVEKLTGDLAQALGASGDEGVLVTQVLEDTPAQKAGIRAGDVIVRVEGDDVNDPDELVKQLADHDGSVSIELLRRGDRRTVQADIGDRSESRRLLRDPARRGTEIPEPGQGRRVIRGRTDDSDREADLRREIEDLKRELQRLREEMRERR